MFDPSARNFPSRRDVNTLLVDLSTERFDLRLIEVLGKQMWVCGGQAPTMLLRDALEHAGFDRMHPSTAVVDIDVAHAHWESIARELYTIGLYSFILRIGGAIEQGGKVKRELEKALFECGFTKHPEYYRLCGYEQLNNTFEDRYGYYQRLDESLVSRYSTAYLLKHRELHMDMSRENGDRSDAHVIRYLFGAEEINNSGKAKGRRRVLDACCGYGYGTALLAYHLPSALITGVDIESDTIAYAADVHGSDPRIDFHEADLLSFLRDQPEESFDSICFFEGMEHIEEIDAILQEIGRVLTREGCILVSVPNSWVNEEGIDPNPNHVEVYNWDNFRSTLSRHLCIEDCYAQCASRLNRSGKWIPAKRFFHKVNETALSADPAEWWIAKAVRRAVPRSRPSKFSGSGIGGLDEMLLAVTDRKVKAVSFDVFDTLLVRPTLLPADIFILLEAELIRDFGPLFDGFAALRTQAEVITRRAFDTQGVEDILLTEIYDLLASYMYLSDEQAAKALARELALETSLLYVRQSARRLFDAARSADKRIIIASDIYLDTGQLGEILTAKGLVGYDHLYVSGESRRQKRRGTLYDVILADLAFHGIVPGEVLHFGDNFVSDVARAKEKGIKARHFQKPTETYSGGASTWPSGPPLSSAEEADFGLRSMQAAVITRVFDDPSRRIEPGTVFDRDPFLYGALRLAPFVFFSMLDFLRACKRRELGQVYFSTRDGHLVKAVFCRLVEKSGVNIATNELSVSRKTLQLLDLKSYDDLRRILPRWLTEGKCPDLGTLITQLTGLPARNLLSAKDSSLLGSFCQPIDWSNLADMLDRLGALWPEIERPLEARRTGAELYVNNLFSAIPAVNSAIWDVGYFHSVARCFDQLGHRVGLSAHVVELSHHQSRKTMPCLPFDTISTLGAINNTLDKAIYDTRTDSVFLELLLSDPTSASRLHYTTNGEPLVFAATSIERERNAGPLEAIHDGVMTAVELMLDWYGPAALDMKCSPNQTFQLAFGSTIMRELARGSDLFFENGVKISLSGLVGVPTEE
jgi:SAM-dependent methyltransferase/FMN phosphatase YigB (HAD superfamily)